MTIFLLLWQVTSLINLETMIFWLTLNLKTWENCHWSHKYKLLKAGVRYFSIFLKGKCISSFFRTKYIEKKFNLQLLFLPTVSRTFILSRATMRYPPPWNFLFGKNNLWRCRLSRWIKPEEKWTEQTKYKPR